MPPFAFFMSRSLEFSGGVLDNSRGNAGGTCRSKALAVSSKLLPVLIEVVGAKFPFIVLV